MSGGIGSRGSGSVSSPRRLSGRRARAGFVSVLGGGGGERRRDGWEGEDEGRSWGG